MFNVEEKESIRRAVLVEGKSQRQAARELGCSRNTVRKMLEAGEVPRYKLKQGRESPILGPYQELIVQWVKEDEEKPKKKRRTATRMYQILRAEHGYQGAESTLRVYVGGLRRKERHQVYVPLSYDPGEVAQVDFGEAEVVIGEERWQAQLFVMWLGYSGACLVQAYPSQCQEAFFDGHVRSFEFFGGVPRAIWYDNLKPAVAKVLQGGNRVEQDTFVAFRSHYLFTAQFCNVRSGWEKGGVEGRVGYSRRNWLTPVMTFASWEAVNAYLQEQCRQDRERRLYGRSESISERLREEQSALLPLPAHAYACCKLIGVRANRLSLVSFDGNRYSVPVEHAHASLWLRAYVHHIEISNGAEQIAVHPRCWGREQDILEPQHYLPLLKRRPRAFSQAQPIRQWQERWPAVFDRYWQVLQERNEGSSAGTKIFINILQLCRQFSEEQVAAALQQALTQHLYRYEDVAELLRRLSEPALPAALDLSLHPALALVRGSQPDVNQFNQLLVGGGRT